MEKYICTNCGYVYEPEVGDELNGIRAGIRFEDLSEDWKCPICYVDKYLFDPL